MGHCARKHQASVADHVLDERKDASSVRGRSCVGREKGCIKWERKHQVSVADRVLDERKDASSVKGCIKRPWQIVC